ncbi:heterokaryon incompatibility protein-domain-containing protein [Phyllosticta capitalensis]
MSMDVTSPPSINWDNIRYWLNESCPNRPLVPNAPGFRLVDVVKQAVVRAPQEHLEYVCLSYVWGTPAKDDIFATSETIASLEEDGSLLKLKIPATIRDAMTVCQHLGQRYLWVDRLCILQDDDDPHGQKKGQIERMGDIYYHAIATLVAATGTDARSGLCGVSTPLEATTERISSYDALQKSKWATRGWTFQESCLSDCLIFFFSFDVRLNRRQSTGSRMERSFRDVGPKSDPGTYTEEYTLEYYEGSAEEYSSRDLGCQNDAMVAFSGVCAHFHGPHRFCLPETGFDNAMTWKARQRPRQRRYSQGCPLFPSWSWVSIKGQVTFQDVTAPHFPVASWAFVDGSLPDRFSIALPKPKESLRLSSYFAKSEAEIAYLANQARMSGLILSEPAEILSLQYEDWDSSLKFSLDEGKFEKEWPAFDQLWEACRGVNRLESQRQPLYFGEFSGAQKGLAARPGRILGLSRAVSSNVGPVNGERSEFADYIIYHGQKPVGVGWFDDVSDTQELLKKNATFFALSVLSSERWWASKFIGDKNLARFGDIFHPQRETFRRSQWDPHYAHYVGNVVQAIAIEETEETGVFRRIGTGMIRRQEWTEMGHEWKSIVLE